MIPVQAEPVCAQSVWGQELIHFRAALVHVNSATFYFIKPASDIKEDVALSFTNTQLCSCKENLQLFLKFVRADTVLVLFCRVFHMYSNLQFPFGELQIRHASGIKLNSLYLHSPF